MLFSPNHQDPVRVVLGPTNTGKTHLALERMLGYPSGMIGLPLRLLAREVYDRLLAGHFGRVHKADVALVTGEEKIIPPNARYFICTVEAMPISRTVDFLAIDEIQLAADLDRGHIFTDRILHARGRQETMLLGAQTMESILRKLLPRYEIETRERFSALRWVGPKKLSRLPRRAAIAAFSAENVYAIAEIIRQQKGGAAVVMGALSPRTRNAQVELYQSGEVDYLVATDAIGMGLNMDIDHVAFAQTRKFDGRNHRALTPAEIAQIAGRAGRHTSDGGFGVTGELPPFTDEIIERIENHDFDAVKVLMWRNPNLDFTSLDALILSLEAPPPRAGLSRAPMADDLVALTLMRHMPDIIDSLGSESRVRLLWEVAQIPDFRKTMASEHASLLSEIFLFLTRGDGRIAPDWIAERIDRCDRDEGDLDTLSTRISHVRTWNYVAHKSDWLADPDYWQEKSKAVEDRLSDALHRRLTRQFVDRKSTALMRKLRGNEDVMAHVDENGDITIDGEFAGRLSGLTMQRDPRLKGAATGVARRAVEQAANQEIIARANIIIAAEDDAFTLDHGGQILWGDYVIADFRYETEIDLLAPLAVLHADEMLNGSLRQQTEARITRWLRSYFAARLGPLADLKVGAGLDGLARGLAFQLLEAHASLPRQAIVDLVKDISPTARAGLRKIGVRFGEYNIFMPALLKPAAAQLLALCVGRVHGRDARADFMNLPKPGLTSAVRDPKLSDAIYRAAGYHSFQRRVIRLDILERLADLIRDEMKSSKHGFSIQDSMLSILGCGLDDMKDILDQLGYRGYAPAAPTQAPALEEPITPSADTPLATPVKAGSVETTENAPAENPSALPIETGIAPAPKKNEEAQNPIRALVWKRNLARQTIARKNKGSSKSAQRHKNSQDGKSSAPNAKSNTASGAAHIHHKARHGSKGAQKVDIENSPFAALAALQTKPEKSKTKQPKNKMNKKAKPTHATPTPSADPAPATSQEGETAHDIPNSIE